jgi:hypothetical protein
MNPDFVQLDRHFSLLSKTQEEAEHADFLDIWGDSKSKSWSQIEDGYRTVILAEAGAGKTEEMKQRARKGVANGRAAFFIRIEDIDIDFEDSFEVGDPQSFADWLASSHEGWFYLDSVDEARLKDPAAFRKALQRFARRIKASAHRAHIVVSSRPYAWQPRSDRAFMDEVLYLPAPESQENAGDESVEKKEVTGSALQVFRLKPLDKSRARIFAEARGVLDFERLWTEIERLDLSDLAERPFDLEAIISKWKVDGALNGRLKLLRHIVNQRLGEIDPDRERRQPLGLQKARAGARLLAAAVILTGEAGIRVPDAAPKESGTEANQLLPDWNPNDVRALLERAIFNDVIFGAVRFRHRETRELLAAEWFFELLKSGTSRHSVEALIFRKQYGVEIISPRLRPILPWLILFDENIRNRTLAIDPGIFVEGGDPAELPLSIRKEILSDIVGRIASRQDRGKASDNSAIARIAHHDLADDVFKLIEQHAESDDAIFFLARLVWQGGMSNCVSSLLHIAADSARRNGVRIVSTRALMTSGTNEQKLMLWNLLLEASTDIPRELVAELVRHSPSDSTCIELLLKSINRIAAGERFKTSGLTRALHEFVDRLPIENKIGVKQPIELLISGFNEFLDRPPYIERGECHVSQKFTWLLGPAIHAVERAVANRLDSAMTDAPIAIMLKVPLARYWKGEESCGYKDKLSEYVPNWPELNDHLFWKNIEMVRVANLARNGEPLQDDWPVQWPGHYWSFESDSFSRVIQFIEKRTFEDDRLVALALAYRVYAEAGKTSENLGRLISVVAGSPELEAKLQQLQNPQVSKQARKWQKEEKKYKRKRELERLQHEKSRSEWIVRLKDNPDIVRNPPGLGPGIFSNDQYWLFGELEGGIRTHRGHETDWQSLTKDFGQDVARAFRDAAVAHWRLFRPELRSEGAETGSTPYSLIFAMAGLDIEARETPQFPGNLGKQELLHALRYITWELNGFPRWLEATYRSFPEQVMSAIQTELFWELTNTKSDQPMHYILHDLAYYALWLHPALVEPVLAWTLANEVPSRDALRHILLILKSGGGQPDVMAALAKRKVATSHILADLPYWYAVWVDAEPETGIAAVEGWLAALSAEQSSESAQVFIAALMGSCHDGGTGSNIGNFRTTKHLKSLYVLMYRYIRASEDINRAGGGCYSPELRDYAQDARNRLFNLLSEIRGKATYISIKELIKDHPDVDSRPWMAKVAYKHAEEDGELDLWTAEQVRQFAIDKTRLPTSHRQLFDNGVARIIDLKNWLERGNDSPFLTWQRAAGETEMRNLVAGWLNTQSGSRFTCAQENELSNKQRPDIFLQNSSVTSAVPIELKLLDKNWSGPKLCERLRNQLAGDYLREETAGCGVMLLIWQGTDSAKKWQIGGRRAGISGLRDALMEYWESISDSFSNVSAIEVIVVDLTIRALKADQ